MQWTIILALAVVLLVIELCYFKIATHYHIIDQPNHRSSHTQITIRGGGIIFTIAALIWFVVDDFQYIYFIIGLFLITVISLLDDIFTLNNKIRLSIHLTAVLLTFQQWSLFSYPWYWLLLALVFVIGTINAYNFMDGVNGITGSYSLLAIGTLYYINNHVSEFTNSNLLILIGLSLLVFNFFNFRQKAKCFAGDVGSVSIAFIVVFLIGQLIIKTANLNYIFLLLVYGLDTAFTVLFRKIRKENIFKAHRSHFYQYLSNQKRFSHLRVSVLYFTAQLLINYLLISWVGTNILLGLALILTSSIIFLALRFNIEGRDYLLKAHN